MIGASVSCLTSNFNGLAFTCLGLLRICRRASHCRAGAALRGADQSGCESGFLLPPVSNKADTSEAKQHHRPGGGFRNCTWNRNGNGCWN